MTDKDYAEILKGLVVPIHAEAAMDRAIDLLERGEDEYIKVPKKAMKYVTKGMVAYNYKWLREHFDIERLVVCGDQKPCEDVISREAILLEIDKIKDNYGGLLDVARFIRGLPSVNPQPKTGHWIPVSERLPEDDQSVLVWCPQYRNIYCAYLEKGQWWVFGAFVQIVPNEVVAWMPLPESYKAESEE